MSVCIDCGLGTGHNPHAADCPRDASVSRQRRWQRRMAAKGCCQMCGGPNDSDTRFCSDCKARRKLAST